MADDRKSGVFIGDGAGLRNGVITLIIVLLAVFGFASIRLVRDLARTGSAELTRRNEMAERARADRERAEREAEATGSHAPVRVLVPPDARPIATGLRPRGSPGSWVSSDDYPLTAIRAEQQGVVAFRLSVDRQGRPAECVVTRSSGVAVLDEATCSLMMRRARFEPARDAEGRAIPASWSTRFRWELP